MDASTTFYTEEDLSTALYAYHVDMDVEITRSAPCPPPFDTDEQKVFWYESSITYLNLQETDDMDYFRKEVVPKETKRYQRGKKILGTCTLVSSGRSIVLGDSHYDEMVKGETIVSPVIRMPAGHIATSEAERYIALALRKGA